MTSIELNLKEQYPASFTPYARDYVFSYSQLSEDEILPKLYEKLASVGLIDGEMEDNSMLVNMVRASIKDANATY